MASIAALLIAVDLQPEILHDASSPEAGVPLSGSSMRRERTDRMSPRTALTTTLTLLALTTPSLADPMFSVTDLGTADPNSNYLNALTPADQSAFKTGSFDVFAHPAQPGALAVSHQGDIIRTSLENGDITVHGGYVTSNNKGVDVGVGSDYRPPVSAYTPVISTFYPDPHTVIDPYTHQTIQSPGFVVESSIGFPSFNGSVSGINDYSNIIGSTNRGNEVPFLLSGSGSRSSPPGNVPTVPDLGSLGGKNGEAKALNNSDEVVGWSEIADGTHHGFLYSNGSIRDLNTLIPPLPGVVLSSAVGIDGAGRIVAFGTDSSGGHHEYLLTPGLGSPSPVPEPSILALVGLAICGCAVRRLVQRRHRLL
jgi:probable HAF family extracellular repeat protein